MGRMYYAPITAAAVATSINLWSIQPAAEDPIVLHAFEISQSTEFGDTQAEALELNLTRRIGAPTTGAGAAVTEVPAMHDDTTSTATVLTELTADWTAGTEQIMAKIGWNVQASYLWMPPPEGRIQVKDNDVLLLDLVTVPADVIDVLGWILYEEV
jgi:hypothetical protein